MNKNGLEMFVDELEDLIIREDQNPSPKSAAKSRLWELSIITKCIEEHLKYLEGFLKKEKYPRFKFVANLFYAYNLTRLIKNEKTPKHYLTRLENISKLYDLMNEHINKTRNYQIIYKIIEKMLFISISLWLEEISNYDLKPLKTLIGENLENYIRLLTDLDYRNERHHDKMIPYFIKLFQDSNL